MTLVRPALAWAVIALGGALAAGCDATLPPPIPRHPDGPCLQVLVYRSGRASHATLWRGELLIGTDLVNTDLDEPLLDVTADNPASHREAEAYHNAHLAAGAVVLAGLATFAALFATGIHLADESHHETAGLALSFASFLSVPAGVFGALALSARGQPHLRKAIDLYNANPPDDCGPPVPYMDEQGSS